MKISELIKDLKRELRDMGDMEIYISIDPTVSDSGRIVTLTKCRINKIYATQNLRTGCDNIVDDRFKFVIKNWKIP